ncbi:long-chain-fatty-acid--CoA ligase [Allostella sp. ATCC 35155]|nr:long-chain-fatty-acid--CoA ligase [Stella sp. ATCC 35155]
MDRAVNVVDPILARAREARPAIERDGTVLTFADLARRLAAFSAGLRAHGCGPGDVVALSLSAPLDSLVGYLGAMLGGQIPVQIDPKDAAPERERLRTMTGAVLTVAESGGHPGMAEILAAGEGADPVVLRVPGGARTAHINLSSGTTGLRKAVPLTHDQQDARSRQTILALGLGPADRHMPILPVHFAFGRQAAVRVLLAGGTLVIRRMPEDVPTLMERLRAERISHIEATPSHLRYLLDRLPAEPQPALPGLRCLAASTAMLGIAERIAVRRRLTPNLYITYGSNEMGVVACARPADLDHDPATVGCPLPGCEIAVTDEAGAPVPPGTVGEGRVRTANAASRYVDNEGASGRSFRDGWFLTGDAGRCDASGHLFLAGRLDDRINYGGIKIYPSEIEEVIRRFAGVADVAVVGMPSRRFQDVPIAAVEAPAGAIDMPALMAHCAAEIASARMPNTIVRLDALPRTGNGKVDGPALRRILAERLSRPPS